MLVFVSYDVTFCLHKRKNFFSDWSVWSAWSDCVTERNCGSGERSRRRTCLFSPTGDSCVGSEIETGICSLPSCEGNWVLQAPKSLRSFHLLLTLHCLRGTHLTYDLIFSISAPLMLSNQISGAVFIYDDTDETNPWKGVCEVKLFAV